MPKYLEKEKEGQLEYLNKLNEAILTQIQQEGEIFVSNAVLQGTYALRACIVNFRTSLKEVERLPKIAVRIGQALDAKMR